MWPKLTPIEPKIASRIRSKRNQSKSSQLAAWVRVFAGATSNTTKGLIISSNNEFELFKAAGELSVYGSPTSTGALGVDWDGKPVLGGTDRGLMPSPVINSIEIKEGKDQISRECTFQIKCFSLNQMEIVQKYFLEPGYTICLEWGWNTPEAAVKMVDTSQKLGGILSQTTSRNLDYDTLHDIRVASNGDYDTFLGFIVGGSISTEGEVYVVNVSLRGAPGLPTFLQSQHSIQIQKKEDGVVVEDTGDGKKTFGPSDVMDPAADKAGDRRFKSMFNNLPAQRQIPEVKKISAKTAANQFINFDEYISKTIIDYAHPGFFSSNDFQVAGADISKEKLASKNKYISMDLAIQILNSNGGLESYSLGGKKVTPYVDISTAKIGAFPNMFSTKASALVIPGALPQFQQYYFNKGAITQKANGVLYVEGVGDIGPATFDIQGRKFVEPGNLKEDGYIEIGGYWGYLKNLYVNFDMMKTKMTQSNKNIREVLLDILNEMSSAVNSFWNFQIVEHKLDSDKPEYGLKKGDVLITVIDENWVGENPNKNIPRFYHNGVLSSFLECNLELALSAEMTNKIIMSRLSLTSQTDLAHIGLGGFFESKNDLFFKVGLDASTPVDSSTDKKEDKAPTKDEAAAKIDALQKKLSELGVSRELSNSKEGGYVFYDKKDNSQILLESNYPDIAEYKKILQEIDTIKSDTTAAIIKEVTANIEKIDIVPNPALTTQMQKSDIEKAVAASDDTSAALFSNNFRIYCYADTAYLDRLKSDAFQSKGGMSHPLPIKYTFKVSGVSGIRRGDTFTIEGIPEKYSTAGFFQVTQVEHTINDNVWTTSVRGEFRQNQPKRKTVQKQIVTKS